MKKALKIAGALLLVMIAITAFSSCSKKSYSITNVRYDPEAKMLTWSDNSEAEKWIVEINGKDKKVSSPSYSYDAEDKAFTFSIEGLHKRKGHDKNPTVSGTMTYLDQVTGLRIEDGKLIWDTVARATGYEIYNNGNLINTSSTNSIKIDPGNFSYTVLPTTNGFSYSYMSDPLSGSILESPQNITYEDGVIRWSAVNGADYYTVKIDDEEFTAQTNELTYPGKAADFKISVAAGSNGSTYPSAPFVQECYYMKAIEEFSFDANGNLTWEAFPNADGYIIELDGISSTGVSPICTNISFDTLHTIKVMPYTSKISYSSQSFEYKFEKLSEVRDLDWSVSSGTVTWTEHPRAVSYELIINGETIKTTNPNYTLNHPEKDLDMRVYAIGSLENSRSYKADSVTYTYIPKATGLAIKDGELVWNGSASASGYTVKLGGASHNVSSAKFTNFNAGTRYTVTVIPYGLSDRYYSYESDSFSFTVLAAPIIRYNAGTVLWNTVSNAKGYTVEVSKDGVHFEQKTLGQTELSYLNNYTAAGKYTIKVKATSTEAGFYSSAYSNSFEIIRLATPNGHSIKNSTDNSGNPTITVNSVVGATKYLVTVNGQQNKVSTSAEFTLNLSTYATNSEQIFNVGITPQGNMSSTISPVYLDALTPYTFSITRLTTPQNVTVSGGEVIWDAVKSATKYTVVVGGTEYTTTTNSLILSNVSQGTQSITVRAESTAKNYIFSKPSNPIKVTKLAPVTGLTFSTVGSDTRIKWNAVSNASSYAIKFGNNTYDWTHYEFSLTQYLGQIPAGTGMQITVYAKGNGSNILDSEPSSTLSITRFATPQNVSIQGENIIWNDCSVDQVKASNYKLYIDGIEHTTTGTAFSTASLSSGVHTIKVKALGNGSSTLDSDYSAAITVTKLASVTNIGFEVGTGRLTWDAVEFAQDYVVVVDGTTHYTASNFIDLSFERAGTYTISITPRSTDEYTISGKAVSRSQSVKAITTPVYTAYSTPSLGEFKITQNDADMSFTVTAAAPKGGIPESALTYRFIVNEIVMYEGPESTYLGYFAMYNSEHTVKIQYVASCFGSDGVYYIDSNPSQQQTIICVAQ